MSLDLFYYTNKGGRELNEDSYGIRTVGKRTIAVLCDGLGGHNCGEVASELAVKSIMEGVTQLTELGSSQLLNVLKITNERILKQQEKPGQKGMRTTAVGCVVDPDAVTYFNSGDSRFYYFRNGSVYAMSKDHSVSQVSVDMGEMSFDEIRFDTDRNKLIKVLGESTSSEIGSAYPPVTPQKGDAFLLCSDGFWEYILEEEMEIDLSKSDTAKEWIEFMAIRILLKLTPQNDNFTVVCGIFR